jgi:hypothetical protein
MKGTIGNALALRVWGFCLAICCLASTCAIACSPSAERGIFFEHVPTDIDAPVIIEATIYGDGSQVGDVAGNQMMVMNARVDRVIKGPIDAKTLKIFVCLGACTRVGVGQGIVLGELRDDPLRGPMLEAIEGANFRTYSIEFREKQEAIWAAVTHEK